MFGQVEFESRPFLFENKVFVWNGADICGQVHATSCVFCFLICFWPKNVDENIVVVGGGGGGVGIVVVVVVVVFVFVKGFLCEVKFEGKKKEKTIITFSFGKENLTQHVINIKYSDKLFLLLKTLQNFFLD